MKNNLSEEEYNALVRDAMRWRSEDNRCFSAAFKALGQLESVRYMWNGPIHQAVALLRDATGPQPESVLSERGEVSTQFKAVGYVDLAGVAHWEPGRLTEGVEAMLYIAEGKHG